MNFLSRKFDLQIPEEKANLLVPLHLRDAVTLLMKDLDYGKDSRYVHDDPYGVKAQSDLPKELEDCKYYRFTGFPPVD